MNDGAKLQGNKVLSPCVGQCGLDESDTCVGCYRLASEIGGWLNKSEQEKLAIVVRSAARKDKALSHH